ncbi:MAG: DUF4362 domain-containing protein [Bacillota bacterium]
MKKTAVLIAVLLCIAAAGCSPEKAPVASNAPSSPPAATASAAPEDAKSPFAIELADLPEEYTSEEAIANGDYVNVHGQISNADAMTAFLDAVAKKAPAAIRTVSYTVEGDPIIADIVFDGSVFSVTNDATRDAFGAQEVTRSEYQNLLEYEGEGTVYTFLTNETEITKELYESGFDGYLLTIENAG